MQIHTLQSGPIFSLPDRDSRQVPRHTSPRDLAQQTERDQEALPDPTQISAGASKQTTGKAAVQKPEEVTKDLAPRLNLTDQKIVQDLKKRDREVRAHEAAHLGAAGPYAGGGARYTYQRGPDGRPYAVGGEVQIDTAEVPGDPEATLQKARVIRRAANAPVKPSAQDRRIANQAAIMEAEARAELAEQKNQNRRNVSEAAETKANEGGDHSQAVVDDTDEPLMRDDGRAAAANDQQAIFYPNTPRPEEQIRHIGHTIDLTA
ncbi:MAG: putative metalloprotease CJM1_0395 family protein [Nitrospiria bacterium]